MHILDYALKNFFFLRKIVTDARSKKLRKNNFTYYYHLSCVYSAVYDLFVIVLLLYVEQRCLVLTFIFLRVRLKSEKHSRNSGVESKRRVVGS